MFNSKKDDSMRHSEWQFSVASGWQPWAGERRLGEEADWSQSLSNWGYMRILTTGMPGRIGETRVYRRSSAERPEYALIIDVVADDKLIVWVADIRALFEFWKDYGSVLGLEQAVREPLPWTALR
jgi:hypothetical protein